MAYRNLWNKLIYRLYTKSAKGVEDLAVFDANLKEKAYRVIRQMIVGGGLPPGKVLNERELVELIGVSRTPIREALHRLEKENLVIIVPQRGAFVCEITTKIINDIYQLRELIEPQLLAMVTADMPEQVLAEFRAVFLALKQDEYNELARIDNEFHIAVIDRVGNDYLRNLMDNMYAQNERIRFQLTRLPQRLQETVAEHVRIIDAMLARDPEKAAAMMREHLISSRKAAFRL